MSPYIIPGLPNLRKKKLDWVQKAVCEATGLEWEEIVRKGRQRERVQARMMVTYLLRKHSGMKLTTIGRLFNHHHTTVISSINVFQNLIDTKDAGIMEDFKRVCKKLDIEYSNN